MRWHKISANIEAIGKEEQEEMWITALAGGDETLLEQSIEQMKGMQERDEPTIDKLEKVGELLDAAWEEIKVKMEGKRMKKRKDRETTNTGRYLKRLILGIRQASGEGKILKGTTKLGIQELVRKVKRYEKAMEWASPGRIKELEEQCSQFLRRVDRAKDRSTKGKEIVAIATQLRKDFMTKKWEAAKANINHIRNLRREHCENGTMKEFFKMSGKDKDITTNPGFDPTGEEGELDTEAEESEDEEIMRIDNRSTFMKAVMKAHRHWIKVNYPRKIDEQIKPRVYKKTKDEMGINKVELEKEGLGELDREMIEMSKEKEEEERVEWGIMGKVNREVEMEEMRRYAKKARTKQPGPSLFKVHLMDGLGVVTEWFRQFPERVSQTKMGNRGDEKNHNI